MVNAVITNIFLYVAGNTGASNISKIDNQKYPWQSSHCLIILQKVLVSDSSQIYLISLTTSRQSFNVPLCRSTAGEKWKEWIVLNRFQPWKDEEELADVINATEGQLLVFTPQNRCQKEPFDLNSNLEHFGVRYLDSVLKVSWHLPWYQPDCKWGLKKKHPILSLRSSMI